MSSGRIVLMAALVASVALNAFMAWQLFDAFRTLQIARIFPLGFAEDRSQQPVAPADRPILAFIGDSRAYHWPTDAWRRSFAVVNHAHGGQTSRQVLLQIRELPEPHVAICVVQVGINDLHPLGVMAQDSERIVAALKANLRDIVAALSARSDLVVVTTIVPAGEVPWRRVPLWSDVTRAKIVEVNAEIAAIAATAPERVAVLDAYRILRAADADRLAGQYADRDFFLHVNSAGYARLDEALGELLRQRGMLRD
jgi:lysophospholipase L1-like esterase